MVRLWDLLVDALGLLAGAAIGFIAVSVSAEIIGRAIGLRPFGWTLEVAEYLLLAATFLGAPWVLRRADHVRVDIVVPFLPAVVRRPVRIAVESLAGVICLVLAFYGFDVMEDAYTRGSTLFRRLVIPQWPILMVMPVGMSVLAVEFFRRAVATARGRTTEQLPGGL